MGRDKAKDDRNFNCDQEHELNYVSGLYDDALIVKAFLKESCADKTIKYAKHMEIYKLIEKELGYAIPVHNF